MERCDVLVVGGGPGGSSCAARLRAAGLDVVVLDRAEFPRDKPCAGWVTPGVFEALDLAPDDYGREGRTLQPVLGFRIGILGGRSVEALYDRPVSYGILRCEFDHHLLRRSGARVRLHAALHFRREGGAWVVDDAFAAPVIVGAGGHFCPVARHLNPAPAAAALVTAQEAEIPLTAEESAACPVRPEVPELYFCPDLQGYGWCVRKGGHLNAGLGRREEPRLREHVAAFVERLSGEGRIPSRVSTAMRGHAYLLHQAPARRVVDDGVLLVGDAAGLAYAESGEGIRPAVESGRLAADALLRAAGDYRRERLAPYAAALERRFGPALRGRRLPHALQAGLGAWLIARPWFARHVVVERFFLRAGLPAVQAA